MDPVGNPMRNLSPQMVSSRVWVRETHTHTQIITDELPTGGTRT